MNYHTCIRQINEYAAAVRSPHAQSDIHNVEMLQRKAVRFLLIKGFSRVSSVSNMVEHLDTRAELLSANFINVIIL